MQNEIFPWIPQNFNEEKTPFSSVEKPKDKISKSITLLKKAFPLLLIGLVLLLIFFATRRDNSSPPTTFEAAQITVYTTLIPIQKGEIVPLEVLRNIQAKRSLFSKTQILELLNEDNLQNLKGRLVAKKTLFPNQPLFWKDLELKKTSAAQKPFQIIYAQ